MFREKLSIHIFYCSSCMTESEARSLQSQLNGDRVKMLPLPCSGKITMPYLLKAFETGADAVCICSCVPTECRHLEGHLRASKRAVSVDELLDEAGLGKGRVVAVEKGQGDIQKVIECFQRLQTKLHTTAAPSSPALGGTALASIRPDLDAGNRRENAA